MRKLRKYPNQFEQDRGKAFSRSRAQALFLGQTWTITFEEFCEFWPTEELFYQRSTKPRGLVLHRRDQNQGWTTDNCVIVTRYEQLIKTNHLRKKTK